MNETKVHGYRHKTTEELVKAIDECTSLSQLFALIQHEHITIQMLTRPGASNLAPKILSPKEITGNRDTPFERLRKQVRESVLEDERRLKQSMTIHLSFKVPQIVRSFFKRSILILVTRNE